MGTSSSYLPPTGGEWTKLKRRATGFAHSGGEGSGLSTPAGILSAFVGALGGAVGAAKSSTSAISAAQNITEFAAAVHANGLEQALREYGLDDAIGQPVEFILGRLLDHFTMSGNDLEQSAARDAVAAIEDEMLERCSSSDDLEDEFAKLVDSDKLAQLLASFLSVYIFKRLLETIKRQLRDGTTGVEQAAELENQIRTFIDDCVVVELHNIDISTFDWRGADGAALVERVLRDAYEVLTGDVP